MPLCIAMQQRVTLSHRLDVCEKEQKQQGYSELGRLVYYSHVVRLCFSPLIRRSLLWSWAPCAGDGNAYRSSSNLRICWSLRGRLGAASGLNDHGHNRMALFNTFLLYLYTFSIVSSFPADQPTACYNIPVSFFSFLQFFSTHLSRSGEFFR